LQRAILKQAAEALRKAERVVLASHVNPDGDTLGSALALAHALRAMGKTAVPLSHDGVPEILRWMPGTEWVERDTAARDFDLAVVCDTGTTDRIGRARPVVECAPASICVDHHVSEGDFGQIRVVDSRAAATVELVYALLRELRAPFTKAIADCLLCALITDTGSFRYMNVTPNTFRIAGALMRCGACPAAISELVFENRSLASVKLLGRALDSLKVSADGAVAWAHIRARDFEELGATDEETEGIVNHVRAIDTVKIGVLFREIPGKRVRISMRARDGQDVSEVAHLFGGGGHRLAAGCHHEPPLEAAEAEVIAEVQRHVK
jgi:phosphoesterase RecJ-like protein